MGATPARYLTDAALARELRAVSDQWDVRSYDDSEGGGSPLEGLWERMGELETEIKRRANGGALQTEIPMQSR